MSDPREPLQPEDLDLGEIEDAEDDAPEGQEGDDAEGTDDLGTERDDGGPDGGDDPRSQERPARQVGRAAARIQRQQAELADLRRELAEVRNIRQAPAVDPQAQVRAEQEERDRVAMMPPEDQARYWYDKGIRQTQGAMAGIESRLLDRMDRAEFQAKVGADARAARLAPEVERVIAQERAAGNYRSTRQDAYWYLLGRQTDERMGREAPKQRAAAQRRVAGQRTRPVNGAGDAAQPRNRQGGDDIEAVRARLRGQPL